jgi:hypothetical protein
MTLNSEDRREVADFIRSVIEEVVPAAVEAHPQLRMVPGTFFGTTPDGYAAVRLDYDDPAAPDASRMPVIGPHPPHGARVAVLLVPPMSAYVLGEVQIAREDPELAPRVGLDNPFGQMTFTDTSGALVGSLSRTSWWTGTQVDGSRAQLDPFGGFRVFNQDGRLAVVVDAQGVQVRDPDPAKGIIHALIDQNGMKLTADDGRSMTMLPSQDGQVVAPKATSSTTQAPGTTMNTPALVGFTPWDLELRFVDAYADTVLTSAFTPPAGFTEVYDLVDSSEDMTLVATCARRQPADPYQILTFTNTQGGFQFDNGHTVLIKATDAADFPSVRSSITQYTVHHTEQVVLTLAPPAGLAAGDLLIAHVSMGNEGGFVPVSWSVPDGFLFLGAVFESPTGVNTLGSGTWYKVATASEPASYQVTINVAGSPTSTKKFCASLIAVQDPASLQGGADIKFEPASACRVHTNVQTFLSPIGAYIPMDFTIIDDDPGHNFDLTNNRYIVPADGPYIFGFQAITSFANAGEVYTGGIAVNGVYISQSGEVVSPGGPVMLNAHDRRFLSQGDIVEVLVICLSASGLRSILGDMTASESINYFYIQRALST